MGKKLTSFLELNLEANSLELMLTRLAELITFDIFISLVDLD